jgi:ketosteroid isomerase-like protein
MSVGLPDIDRQGTGRRMMRSGKRLLRLTAFQAVIIAATASAAAAAVVAGLWLAPLPAIAAGGHFNSPQDVQALTRIEHELATLTSMKELIKYYAPDAIVLDAFAPGRFRGTREIYDGFEKQFQGVQSMQGEIPDLNVMTDGQLGCAALQLHFAITRADGTKMSIALRELDAFRKTGGRWQIVQQHISFPTDHKTGMGILDAPMTARGPIAWSARPLPGPATGAEQAKREIREWLQVGALSPDLNALMKYYGPGDDVLVYDVGFPPGEFRGLKEVRDGFEPVMHMSDPKMKLLDFTVDSDGSFGVQIDEQELTVTPTGAAPTTFVLRQSDCMRRADGKWYAVLEELSMPVDASNGKAVTQVAAAAEPARAGTRTPPPTP